MSQKLLFFSNIVLFVFIISILAFINPSLSDSNRRPNEVKGTDGSSLGTYKRSKISRSEARLTINIDDKYVDWLSAGHIGNSTYRERWKIEKLKSRTIVEVNDVSGNGYIFSKSRMSKDTIKKVLFDRSIAGRKFSSPGRMELIQEVKLRSNLYYILSKDTYSDVNCAFIMGFFGLTNTMESLGNKNLTVIVCDPEQLRDPKSSLSEALYIFGSATYSGNKLRIGYKFPTKRDVENLGGIFSASLPTSSTPSKIAPSNLDNSSDSYICRLAARNGFWETSSPYLNYVNEAKKRGLSCNVRIEKNNGPLKSSNNELENYERKCSELGFTKGTEKYGDCVMKLYK